MEFQNNLLKRVKFIDGNHSEMFSKQYAQSDNFITTRHYVKNRDARKVLRLTQEQSNDNELNMAQETTNSPRKDLTMTAEKSVEKLPSGTDPADNNFVSSDVNNCINNLRISAKQNARKHRHSLSKLQKYYLL